MGVINRATNLSTRIQTRETVAYFDPQGVRYMLSGLVDSHVLQISDLGMPPIDYVTERGPLQHGESVQDFFLRPRIIQLVLRRMYNNRSGLWTGRNTLLDTIRPNRQTTPGAVSPGDLEIIRSDGSRRRIKVLISDSPGLDIRGVRGWDEWALQDVLRFIAHNPVWYDPAEQTTILVSGSELIFPITFPITFSSVLSLISITYDGTWLEYPTIEIVGPVTGPAVLNTTTGEKIALGTSIPAGRTVTITLDYGNKGAEDDTGIDYLPWITDDSDLATFHLAPAPEAAGGINAIQAYGTGTSVATVFRIKWYRRYIGI